MFWFFSKMVLQDIQRNGRKIKQYMMCELFRKSVNLTVEIKYDELRKYNS